MAEQNKVFNDPIHGHMELHPLLVKIIDTPEFQRLRHIKQLGGTCYVYPGASHNRFEHSIGVAYLAGELLHALKEKQPDLDITERDILCVQIAGLCHDLVEGHGPFSHMFDEKFIPRARPGQKWRHEEGSKQMLDHMVEKNNLRGVFRNHGLVLQQDMEFIKELIDPPKYYPWPCHGRPQEKAFLYEVVSNKRNSIDVDKWDYFARDFYHLGMKNNFDCHRLIKFARVCEVDGWMQICYRDKEVFNLYDMFYTRFCLHKKVCQHKVAKSIEWMITDALLKADEHIQIEGSGGNMFTISTAINNMEAFKKLTDHIFDQILNSTEDVLQEARTILNRILTRDIYYCLGEFQTDFDLDDDLTVLWNQHINGIYQETQENYVVELFTLNYGMGDRDPIQNVRFYKKENPTEAFPKRRAEVSQLLPQQFQERLVRIYTKRRHGSDENADRAEKDAFERFREAHQV